MIPCTENLEQILLAYGVLRETITTIVILYESTKTIFRSPDGNFDFFDTVTGVWQEDTVTPFLLIICLDYVIRTSIVWIKENDFTPKKQEADDIVQQP